ncbi:hypothetical protein [Roseisolibacter agri]|uniref:hypothetical protein n=1 Tax=Roseisolibacter agri TaxID=2014610 RepID=UPI0024E08778|nr:hypothetical protein [Roseisolibacter agri]
MKPRFGIIAISLLLACEQPRSVWSGDVTLTTQPTTLTLQESIRAPGPTHDLCFVPAVEGVRADWDSLVLPAGRGTRVEAVLITPAGQRDTLRHPPSPMIHRDSTGRVTDTVWARPTRPSAWMIAGLPCVWAHADTARGRRYVAIELRADRPLSIRGLHWWSGQRIAMP